MWFMSSLPVMLLGVNKGEHRASCVVCTLDTTGSPSLPSSHSFSPPTPLASDDFPPPIAAGCCFGEHVACLGTYIEGPLACPPVRLICPVRPDCVSISYFYSFIFSLPLVRSSQSRLQKSRTGRQRPTSFISCRPAHFPPS